MYILSSYWDNETKTELFESLNVANKVLAEYKKNMVCSHAEIFMAITLDVQLAKGDCAHCNAPSR
jgi:hypothetical protein